MTFIKLVWGDHGGVRISIFHFRLFLWMIENHLSGQELPLVGGYNTEKKVKPHLVRLGQIWFIISGYRLRVRVWLRRV